MRSLYPRETALPPVVSQSIGNLWNNRRHMDYAVACKAGFSFSSGTVESGAKTLGPQRMKQADMSRSRQGTQAMVALCPHTQAPLAWHNSLISLAAFLGRTRGDLAYSPACILVVSGWHGILSS